MKLSRHQPDARRHHGTLRANYPGYTPLHIEVTPAIVLDWMAQEQGLDVASIAAESKKIFNAYHERAMKFYKGFFC